MLACAVPANGSPDPTGALPLIADDVAKVGVPFHIQALSSTALAGPGAMRLAVLTGSLRVLEAHDADPNGHGAPFPSWTVVADQPGFWEVSATGTSAGTGRSLQGVLGGFSGRTEAFAGTRTLGSHEAVVDVTAGLNGNGTLVGHASVRMQGMEWPQYATTSLFVRGVRDAGPATETRRVAFPVDRPAGAAEASIIVSWSVKTPAGLDIDLQRCEDMRYTGAWLVNLHAPYAATPFRCQAPAVASVAVDEQDGRDWPGTVALFGALGCVGFAWRIGLRTRPR